MAEPAAPPFENLADALDWLDAHIDFEQNMPRRRAWPTLDRIHALTSLLGEPQDSIPSIHVTGTNGKGSTSAMASALLLSKGLSVGTYTSPNLHTVSERIARNAEPIDDDSFTAVLTELALLESLLPERPTRFDLLTAAAFSWFASEAVDTMVVEVGLGGTWDTTNVIHGDVAVVTNVSFDHTDVLGPTLEGIAADKAGIIEPEQRGGAGRPARGPAGHRRGAGGRGRGGVGLGLRAGLRGRDEPGRGGWPAGHAVDARAAATRTSWSPCTGRTRASTRRWRLAAVEAFFGEPLTLEVVEEGFAAVRVPGRLEVLGRRPLLLVDGAHNAAGMATLGDALNEEFAVDGTKVAVVGMLSGRDPSAMMAPLASAGVAAVVLCQPDTPRAMPLAAMAEAARATRAGGARGTRRARRAAPGPRHGRRRRARRGLRFALRGGRGAGRRVVVRRALGGSRPLTGMRAGLCNLDSSWTAPLSL